MLRIVRDFHQDYELDRESDTTLRKESLRLQAEISFVSPRESSLRLHAEGIAVSKRYRTSESDMIDMLRKLDDDKTFHLFDCTGLVNYSVKYHKLSKDVVLNLVNVMNKSRLVPELADAVRSGAVDISKARKITPVITPENKSHWLDIAKTKSLRDVEKAVADAKPELSTNDSLKHKGRGRMELRLGVSIEWSDKLKRIQDLLSQKEKRAVGREEALLIAMNEFIDRHDPLEKAKRADERAKKKTSNEAKQTNHATGACESSARLQQAISIAETTASVKSSAPTNSGEALPNSNENMRPSESTQNKNVATSVTSDDATVKIAVPGQRSEGARQRFSAATLHAVNLRDKCQCTELDETGNRCTNRRWLDIHHVKPVSEGGTNDLENLRTLCSAHHRMEHRVHH